MTAYWCAVARHFRSAAFDVLFVTLVSMSPLLFGRLISLVLTHSQEGGYWDFLLNGQLAFFSMSSLASLVLLCFRKKLPDKGTLWIGCFSLICLLFLMALVGADPSLQKAPTWVGKWALFLFLAAVIVRILAEAMKSVGPRDALDAGARASERMEQGLRDRMRGGRP